MIKNYVQEVVQRAISYFNTLKSRIYALYLNVFIAKEDEFYSYEEPTDKQMEGKTYWIQIEEVKEDNL